MKKKFQIELATLDAAYRFWKSYEENLSLSPSPFFVSANALQGNVNGALEYWCGYGTQEYVLVGMYALSLKIQQQVYFVLLNF